MAENKKSFVLYADLIHTIKQLPDVKAGQLFKHILEYVNDENPTTKDVILKIAFEPIKQQLKRDLCKYEERANRSRENGTLGGRPKNPKKPSGLINNPKKPRKPDSVNVNDNVNDINKYRGFKHLSISTAELNKLLKDFKQEQIDEVLDAVENYSANKKYTSLYLTALQWLKKRYPKATKSQFEGNHKPFMYDHTGNLKEQYR